MSSNQNRTLPAGSIKAPASDVEAAQVEDIQVQAILRKARDGALARPAIGAQDNGSANFMAKMREDYERAVVARIERKELVTELELAERIGNRQWVSYAMKSGRLFSIPGPLNVPYYPSFYACSTSERREIAKVAKVLATLPGASIFHFFTSVSSTLGMTPLDALTDGRAKDVMRAAEGFLTR